ncbi:flagellar biosynthesis regulator FlaF [Litorisediminicola beolgyonensis]|uniref:Flagellar biosynthesis regulator FlaF n=1 Tax=Litorisediminicola beolgyonensis TaxID=1173614 RepID=A0ABW3ZGH1_9RHOB
MTLLSLAKTGYADCSTSTRTARGVEYDLIALVTHRLRDAARQGKTDYPAFAKAIAENRRLWTVLASSVSDAENGLPNELRSRIFYLAEFTEVHSRRVLTGDANVAPLLEINTAMLRGLATVELVG